MITINKVFNLPSAAEFQSLSIGDVFSLNLENNVFLIKIKDICYSDSDKNLSNCSSNAFCINNGLLYKFLPQEKFYKWEAVLTVVPKSS